MILGQKAKTEMVLDNIQMKTYHYGLCSLARSLPKIFKDTKIVQLFKIIIIFKIITFGNIYILNYSTLKSMQ